MIKTIPQMGRKEIEETFRLVTFPPLKQSEKIDVVSFETIAHKVKFK